MSQVVGLLAAVGLVVCAVVVLVQGKLIPLEKSADETMTLKLNSFKMCPDHLDVPSTFDNMTLYMDPGDEHTLFVDGILNMKEDIPNGTDMIIDVRRCYNEREESCEKYILHVLEDICSYVPQEGMMWSAFVNQIEGLPKTCPLPAGSYRMNEAPVDMSNFQNQTEFLGHWQIEASCSNGKKRYGCAVMDWTLSLRNGAV